MKSYVPRPQKEIDHIVWKGDFGKDESMKELLNMQQKTIEKLGTEIQCLEDEIDEFMSWLLPYISGEIGMIVLADTINKKAAEVFK